jgi:hypothetical protein
MANSPTRKSADCTRAEESVNVAREVAGKEVNLEVIVFKKCNLLLVAIRRTANKHSHSGPIPAVFPSFISGSVPRIIQSIDNTFKKDAVLRLTYI